MGGLDEAKPLLDKSLSVNTASEDQTLTDDEAFGEGPKAGFWACCFNIQNAAIGAGVLNYPQAFFLAGLALAPMVTIFAAIMFGFTLLVVGRAQDYALKKVPSVPIFQSAASITRAVFSTRSIQAARGECTMKQGSYQEIVGAILGPAWGKTASILISVFLTIANTAYLIIMWDQSRPVFQSLLNMETKWATRTIAIPLFGGVVAFPLACITNMAYFSVPATLSGVGVVYSVGLVMWAYLTSDQPPGTYPGYNDFDWRAFRLFGNPNGDIVDVLRALPSICFGYQCHLSFPLVYASMKNRTPARIRKAIIVTMFMIASVYVSMGFAGALFLRTDTPSDILLGVCPKVKHQATFYNRFYEHAVSKHQNATGCCMTEENFRITNHPPKDDLLTTYNSNPDLCEEGVMAGSAIARFSIFLSVAVSYGMLSMVVRNSYASLMLGPGRQFEGAQFWLATIMYVGFTIVFGMYCGDLSTPLEFGGILVVGIDVTIPALMLIKMRESPQSTLTGKVLVGVSLILMIVSLCAAIAKIVKPDPG